MSFENDGTQYYTMVEAAVSAGVTRQTIYRWMKEGKIGEPRYVRSRDGRRFFTSDEVEAIKAFATDVRPVGTANQMSLFGPQTRSGE